MTEVSRAVSLKPSSAVVDQPDLSTMSLDEVVSRFKDGEKKRNEHTEPSDQAEVFWPVRHAPVELMSSIKIVAVRLGVSRSVLTKCMSRQVIDWYENSLALRELTSSFNDVYRKIKRRSYTTLRIQAENPAKFSYSQQPEAIYTSVSSIRWVLGKLNEIKEAAGIGASDLLMVGFCWSLTTLEDIDWDGESINRIFRKESDSLREILQDRLVDVKGLCEKYELREANRKSSRA